jgi:hypothetical protein
LRFPETNDTKYSLPPVTAAKELHRITVAIPTTEQTDSLNCSDRCVLRWRYVTETHLWPCLQNGTLDPGCGPQPEARACADVRIVGDMIEEEEEGEKSSRELLNGENVGNEVESQEEETMVMIDKNNDDIQVGVSIDVQPEAIDDDGEFKEGDAFAERETAAAEVAPEAAESTRDQARIQVQFEAVRDALLPKDSSSEASDYEAAAAESDSEELEKSAEAEDNVAAEADVDPVRDDGDAEIEPELHDGETFTAESDAGNGIAEAEAEAATNDIEKEDKEGKHKADQRVNNKFADVEELAADPETAIPEAEVLSSGPDGDSAQMTSPENESKRDPTTAEAEYEAEAEKSGEPETEDKELKFGIASEPEAEKSDMTKMEDIKEGENSVEGNSDPRSFLFPDEYWSNQINNSEEGGEVDDRLDEELGESDKTKNNADEKSKKRKKRKRRKRKEKKKEDEEILTRYLRASAVQVRPIELFAMSVAVAFPYWF